MYRAICAENVKFQEIQFQREQAKNSVRARDMLLTLLTFAKLTFAKNFKKYRRSNFRENKHGSRESKRSAKSKPEYKSSNRGAFKVGWGQK
jgi:hypothetical protein